MPAKKVDLLLLNPPVSMPMPYLSIPTLVPYVRAQGLSVAVCDVNCEFHYRFLTRENVRRGISHASERFLELNGKEELRFTEMVEYVLCFHHLTEVERNLSRLTSFLLPFSDWSVLKQLNIDSLLMTIATLPWFPEILISKPQFMFTARYNEFSSREIIESTGHESFYTAPVREIIKELLDEYDAKVTGISLTFREQALPAFLMARLIKEARPDCHLAIGGTFVSTFMRDLSDGLLFRDVDSFVLDEGEKPLVQLVRECRKGKPDLAKVQSIIYVENGKVIRTEPAEPVDLEKSPPPDYTIFPIDRYTVPREDLMILFRLARGCPWKQCSFCRTDLPYCRDFQQPPEEMLYRHFREVVRQTGSRHYYLSADTADPLVLEYFARKIIEDGLAIQWNCHTRVDPRLTRERCELYRRSGCNNIFLGVESFSDRILKLMNKGITADLTDRVLRQIDGAVDIRLYMISGFPGETIEEAMEGLQKVNEYKSLGLIRDCHFSTMEIMNGSSVYRDPQKYGITALINTPGADLEGGIYNFRSGGMSLKEVVGFIQTHASDQSNIFPEFFRESGKDSWSLILNGSKVEAAYDINQMVKTINSLWEFSFLTKPEWLSLGEERIAPAKRMSVEATM
jgi:radical SAM superfamily enzyme YgiQ (UPF0313 family)